MRNYTSAAAEKRPKRDDELHVVLVVRAGCAYGDAKAGERVLIDATEYERGPTKAALCTVAEHEAAIAAVEQKKAEAAAPKPVTDSITQQLQRLWNGGNAPKPEAVEAQE